MQVNVGDPIAPAGLYMGDRDSFVFLADGDNAVDDGAGNPLMRVLFLSNSEVGHRSFSITEALLQGVCGNHILWGAREVVEVKYRHIGEARDKIFSSLESLMSTVNEPRDLERELRLIEWMRTNNIGTDIDSVVDNVYKTTNKALNKRDIRAGFHLAEENETVDGDPTSWIGIANGLTRQSQTRRNADQRMLMDRATSILFQEAANNAELVEA